VAGEFPHLALVAVAAQAVIEVLFRVLRLVVALGRSLCSLSLPEPHIPLQLAAVAAWALRVAPVRLVLFHVLEEAKAEMEYRVWTYIPEAPVAVVVAIILVVLERAVLVLRIKVMPVDPKLLPFTKLAAAVAAQVGRGKETEALKLTAGRVWRHQYRVPLWQEPEAAALAPVLVV